jgi:hypothetical protein
MAVAVLIGSLGSGGGGERDVFTEQNRQPLVQVSPRSCNRIFIIINNVFQMGRLYKT